MKRNIHVYPDKEKLITATAERIINSIDQAVKEIGLCNIALAGGNTPRGLYALLAMDSYKERVDWSCVHLFWWRESEREKERVGSYSASCCCYYSLSSYSCFTTSLHIFGFIIS